MLVNKKFTISLVVCALLFSLVTVSSAWAGTIFAVSSSYTDVSTAVNAANSGDTVIVPAGNSTWSSTLDINKALTLQGNGIGSTVITSNGITLIKVSVNGNEAFDLSGFTLDVSGTGDLLKIINFSSTTPLSSLRIHNNRFLNADEAIYTEGLVFGLVDNNQFDNNDGDFRILGAGSTSWNLYPIVANYGTANYLYIEDNVSTNFYSSGIVSGEGARWIYRYNSIDGVNTSPGDRFFDMHGDTRNRGVVAVEIYENDITNVGGRIGFDQRGGGFIAFNNNIPGGGWGARFVPAEANDGCTNSGGCDGSPGGDQVQDTYFWSNGVQIIESDPYGNLEEKTSWWDDYNNTPEYFTKGVFASRPVSPADGDCYWATDTRTLYRSVGDNNWTLIYQPYTYPHPMATNDSPAIKSPTNLRIKE